MNDTICAISTALGASTISIIRVSGDESIQIVNKICDKDLSIVKSHTINYAHIIDNNEIIDEVMISVMKAPKTFTKEDIIEINSHGSIATTNKILELLLENGARLAEPGEFTKRAFLNGRIDLIEAESIMDLIEAKTDSQRKLAMNGVDGKISKLIKDIINNLVDINANIEVNIDYPEYDDIEIVTKDKINELSVYITKELSKLLKESEDGKIIKEGINTIILGKPNVGKSSILNKLLDEEKAIVTNIPGTTRDIVEGQIKVNGIILNLIDTAGIRDTQDKVERIGVEKSINLIDKADLIILVFNNNETIDEEDIKLLEKTKNKKRIIVINKIDLDSKIDESIFNNEPKVKISATDNVDKLKEEISDIYKLNELNNKDFTYLSSSREISLIKEAINVSNNLNESLKNDIPIDILEIDIKEICEILGKIIGESYDEKLVDTIFSNFCLGK